MPADLTPQQIAVLRILTEKARAKEHHDKAAEALAYLSQAALGQEIALPNGRRFLVADNFADPVVKKMTFFDRYELREQK